MTEVYCPTCERLLVRTNPNGSFLLAGQANVTAEVPIPLDVDPASLPVQLPIGILPLSVRCLRCHPEDTPGPQRSWRTWLRDLFG